MSIVFHHLTETSSNTSPWTRRPVFWFRGFLSFIFCLITINLSCSFYDYWLDLQAKRYWHLTRSDNVMLSDSISCKLCGYKMGKMLVALMKFTGTYLYCSWIYSCASKPHLNNKYSFSTSHFSLNFSPHHITSCSASPLSPNIILSLPVLTVVSSLYLCRALLSISFPHFSISARFAVSSSLSISSLAYLSLLSVSVRLSQLGWTDNSSCGKCWECYFKMYFRTYYRIYSFKCYL